MKVVLWAAAICSLLSGALYATQIEWFIGAIAATFGLGYLIAADDPYRHWAVVLLGLLSKTLFPVWLFQAASAGQAPWTAAWTTLVTDVMWWIPFGLILKGAFDAHVGGSRLAAPEIQGMALRARTQLGPTIDELSRISPVLLVFLRHSGCPFCREALSELAQQRTALEAIETRITLVHMGSEEQSEEFFRRYGLEKLPRVGDRHRNLYRAFGLGRGGFSKLLGPKVWWRGFRAVILKGHGMGRIVGDGFQMPGVFLVYQGQVIRSYRHQSAADSPNYFELAGEDQIRRSAK